jgi:DNA polymerase III subunit delta
MLTTIFEFERHLEKGRFGSNYFLFGPDLFLIDQSRNALVRALGQYHGGVLTEMMDLDEVSVDEVLNSARCLSLFGSHQILLVRGAMKLRDSQCKQVAGYLSDTNPTTTLIFFAGELDRDQRKKKIFRILTDATRVIELAAPDKKTINEWVRRKENKEGFSIDPEALDFITETQGNDLGRIVQEIEKARLYAGEETNITLPMVESTSGFAGDHELAEFLEAIALKKKKEAMRLIEEIFFRGKETPLAYWWFGLRLRQLLQIQELAGHLSPELIAKTVGIYQRQTAEKLLVQSKKFSRKSLEKALYRLGIVDERIKRSSIDSRFIMELLVHELTS